MAAASAASAARSSAGPVAAAQPTSASPPSGAVTVLPGQRFTPANGQQRAAQQQAAAAQPASDAQAGAQGENQGVDAKGALEALAEVYGSRYAAPVVAADGTVYMQANKSEIIEGRVYLRWAVAGRIDKATGRFFVNEQFINEERVEAERASAKVVQQEGKLYYQIPVKGEKGETNVRLVPLSERESVAYQQQAQKQQSQEELQKWYEDRIDWMQKLGGIMTPMRAISLGGRALEAIAAGPHPLTGSSQLSWTTAYMALNALDSQFDGKIVPKFLKEGASGTAFQWALDGLFMLDAIPSYLALAEKFPTFGRAMSVFSAPLRAIVGGAGSIVKNIGGVAGRALGTPATAQAATAGAAASEAARAAQTAAQTTAQAAQAGGQAAQAATAAAQQAQELSRLGTAIRDGSVQVLDNAHVLQMADGATQVVSKQAVQASLAATEQTIAGAAGISAKASNVITKGVGGAFRFLQPMLGPLGLVASGLGGIYSGMNVGRILKTQGAGALVTTSEGRSAAINLASSLAYLGLLAIPGTSMAAHAVNLGWNVMSGVASLNSAGLFGGGGFLDHDAVRAAFLIPPLTPLGLFGMWMSRRAKNAKRAEAQQEQQIAQARATAQKVGDQAIAAAQQTGTVAGAVRAKDGTLLIPTGLDENLQQVGSSSGSAPPGASALPAMSVRSMSPRSFAA